MDEKRQATRRFRVSEQPKNLTDWGLLGAAVGKLAGSYWAVPVIEGLETVPTSDEAKHMGAAMASYGSTRCSTWSALPPRLRRWPRSAVTNCLSEMVGEDVLGALRSRFGGRGDRVDVVVFAAPQLSLVEMQMVADLSSVAASSRYRSSPVQRRRCSRTRSAWALSKSSNRPAARCLVGTCFYNGFAREIGEANGWTRILSNSAKIVNILGGYGYQPALADMAACIEAAQTGVIQ